MSAAARPGEGHVESACPLDCPDACSLDVTLSGGKVVAIGGSEKNPVTRGYICAKVRRYPEHLYGEARIPHPGIRDGRKGEGKFRRASWDEALGLVAEKLKAVRDRRGGEGILPLSYGGSNGYLSQDTTDARLFYRLGASRLLRTVCAAPSSSAALGLYGKMPGVAYQDYAHARLIVVWGMNPSVSGIHLVPYIQEAQKRGARLVVVDPRRTRQAEHADLHLAIHPGTDLRAGALDHPLALRGGAGGPRRSWRPTRTAPRSSPGAPSPGRSSARRARRGCRPADIEAFARLYAELSPAALRCGWGPERSRNGGSAIAAILALPAVAGKFGVRGGGYTLSNSSAWRDVDGMAAAKAEEPNTRADQHEPRRRRRSPRMAAPPSTCSSSTTPTRS